MRQNLVFVLGSRPRYLLPGIQKTFCCIQDEAEEFRNHQFSCVIFRNSRPRSEFIFEVLWAESIVYFVCSN